MLYLKTLKIGLTGGIGSGKTTIANLLSQLGYPVYIADREASRLTNEEAEIRKALVLNFGKDIYKHDSTLDKKKLADIIFNDKQALQKVNSIVHPVIVKDFEKWSCEQKSKLVFFESAILFEAGLNKNFDRIICVYAPLEVKIQRVINRDHIGIDKVRERINNQLDDRIKCEMSDFVINTADPHMVLEQILIITDKLEQEIKA